MVEVKNHNFIVNFTFLAWKLTQKKKTRLVTPNFFSCFGPYVTYTSFSCIFREFWVFFIILLNLLNSNFTPPKHLGLPYKLRKVISRIRCSNHPLAIERGRYTNPKTPREDRLCELCDEQVIEDEEHFLMKCSVFTHLRDHYQMNFNNISDILNMENQYQLAQYLLSAFELRQRAIWGRAGEWDIRIIF